MSTVHLIGGGRDPATTSATYGPFLRSAGAGAVVGGWRSDGVAVCPEDAAEGLRGATVDGTGSAHCVVAAGSGAVTLTTVRRGGHLPPEVVAPAPARG